METLNFMVCDQMTWQTRILSRYIPKVHEEDSVEVVLGLVGNGVEEESLEHVGYTQIGEQHHVLAEGMWEG
ncbi:hypothetical protein PISMIDRAFT_8181 [Pisolithus microcarpus 441]|uniref:Uncharacterized protein n=1 Tax=Pisolithus microcarpus 441 TaxID=765257 RepID=A0A0C9ZN39_9AGAM|nr:hypothetical protein PISMIDRAFT_8181 [Pisolithus microcarpus 441]